MNTRWHRAAGGAGLAAVVLLAGACEVRSRDANQGGGADVAIRTPVGDMTVRTGGTAVPETGLPVYPGATLLREDGEEPATVEIDTRLFGLTVAAARFESEASAEVVLAFYRDALGRYGRVTECRGNIDFRQRDEASRPYCREDRRGDQVQLVAGTRPDHRIVSVEPRRSGSALALVHVRTTDD